MTTIAQSVLSLSFGRHGRRRLADAALHPSSDRSQTTSPVGMTCEPWEGLYLHDAEAERLQEAPVPNPELERFLLSLMSGE
ncbi:MAG: hypothetical protein JWQ56_1290 [Pseudarthrobacter sp.]|jgi:hypothetical protein|nr:hypothetical protein [Pseudarthrobacter sp.]